MLPPKFSPKWKGVLHSFSQRNKRSFAEFLLEEVEFLGASQQAKSRACDKLTRVVLSWFKGESLRTPNTAVNVH